MKLKCFVCPECIRGKKFASLSGLNIHLGKSHTVTYKIVIVDGKPLRKRKKNSQRAKGIYLQRIKAVH